MADVGLVIKIPKEKYDVIKSDLYNTFPAEMKEWGLEAIRNGTPLPKGHGDLKDADELKKNILCRTFGLRSIDIDNAPTVIEADRGSEQ